MTRRREAGYVALYTKESNSAYQCRIDQWDKIRSAWMSGSVFVETIGIYGSIQVIKLACIEGIGIETAETLAASREDTAAERAEDSITGSD